MNILPLLPPSALDLSVLVAVVAGVAVLFALTEVLGWSFGGLVVPGYLASVLVVAPAAGGAVVAEAVLTAGAVAFLSEGLGATGAWTPFFGRQRFLLVVIVSILVRQACEVWVWPWLIAAIDARFALTFLQPGDVHSIGLVLVPLTANALAKGSVRAGLRQLVVPTAIAFVVLHGLLQGTNVSLGSLSLAYEDVALDFLQSARAYFVLATGAFVATLLNGWFAWSAGGILIPALLGLAWYEPARVVATLVEAVVIATAFQGLTRLPVIRHWNLEGPRKLLILVGLSATLRLAAGWAHDAGLPVDEHVTAGLGYLLSALIAHRILMIGSAATVLVPAFGTSLVAFCGGSAAAWAIEQVFPAGTTSSAAIAEVPSRLLATPEGLVEYARVRVRLDPLRSPSPHLSASALAGWRSWWSATDAALAAGGQGIPVVPPGFRLDAGGGAIGGRGYLVLREAQADLDATEGWGVAVLRPGAAGPAVVVERPWSEGAVARGAVATCAAADCAILWFGGMEVPTGRDDARDGLVAALGRPVVRASSSEGAVSAGAIATDGRGVATTVGASVAGIGLAGGVGAVPVGVARPDASQAAGDLVAARLAEAPATWTAAPEDMEVLTETIVPALGEWARGTRTIDEIRPLVGLLGWRATEDPTCGAGPCLVLVPEGAGPVLVVRSGPATPILVEVPHPHREVGTVRVGLGAFAALGARVAVFDPSEPPLAIPVATDPLHALHLGWRRELASEAGNPLTLLVRGIGAGEPGQPRPTEDVVVGAGRPVFGASPPALAGLVANDRIGGVFGYRWAAADADERGLAGSHIPAIQADLALGGVTPAILWVSEAARAAWRGEARDAVAEWVAAAGLTLEDGSGTAAVAGAARGSLPELAGLARRAAHQHNLNLLRALVERGGAGVRAAWDPARQLAFVEVRAGGGAARAWVCPGDDRVVTLPADAGEPAIRAAIGWLPADLVLEGGTR